MVGVIVFVFVNVFDAFLRGILDDNAVSGIEVAEILAPLMVGEFVPKLIVCVAEPFIPPVVVIPDAETLPDVEISPEAFILPRTSTAYDADASLETPKLEMVVASDSSVFPLTFNDTFV
jgi:hypothetical protein